MMHRETTLSLLSTAALVAAACLAAPASAVTVTVVSDDLSTLANFTNTTHLNSSWASDGTDAVYTNVGGGGSRASLNSDQTYDFNPGEVNYDSVSFEFTTTIANVDQSPYSVNRVEFALIETGGVAGITDQLINFNVNAALVRAVDRTTDAGLFVMSGTAPTTAASADVAMTASAGTHTYKLVFTSTGSELFRDNVSQGTTTQVIDFTKDYRIHSYAQHNGDVVSLNNVSLAATGANVQLALAADVTNSDTSGFGGSVEETLVDPFAHNSASPTSELPVLTFSIAAPRGFHGIEAAGDVVDIAYTLVNGDTALTALQDLVIDLYGRSSNTDRDDDFDVVLYDNGTAVATAAGLAIDGDFHLQVSDSDFDVSLTGLTFDALRIAARDSNGPANGNGFTLQEIRVNVVAVPEPSSLALLGLGGLCVLRRRRG